MDYGYVVFGVNVLILDNGGVCKFNELCVIKVGIMGNLFDMFIYGVGIDILYNVINKEDVILGFFFGV